MGSKGVVIEIDGESHDGRFLYDIERQRLPSSALRIALVRSSSLSIKHGA
jgi:very-short-patch-repair endonuclease